MRKVADGAGGLVEVQTKFPIWYDPVASGGTPMRAALTRAAEVLLDWCDAHPSSFPPIVIHLTDGSPTDGTPDEVAAVADQLREISTEDGQVLLMNIHVSAVKADPVAFPSSDATLGNEYAKLLFRMSSVLPEQMRAMAAELSFKVDDQSRGFIFDAKPEQIVQFFEIGTRPSNLR